MQILGLLACAVWAVQADDAVDYRNLTKDNLPHVQVIIQKALDYSSTGRMDSHKMRKKIRWSYLLPMVEVRYGQRELHEYSYGFVTEEYTREYDNGRTFTETKIRSTTTEQIARWQPFWYAYAEWDLGKLVFSREETYSRYIKEQQGYYQQRLVKEVFSLYREVHDLLCQRGDEEDLLLEIDISAAAVKLDFLTGDYIADTIRFSAPKPVAVAPAAEGDEEITHFVQTLNRDGGNLFSAKAIQ